MKRYLLLISMIVSVLTINAQTLNINVGQVTYAYPAALVGDVAITETTVIVGQKTYAMSSISSIYVDNTVVADSSVYVKYNGDQAKVVIAGDIADLMTVNVNGAHVALHESPTTISEINYTLSGTSTNGSLYMDGTAKATFILNGLDLQNPDSAAINIQDGKRIAMILNDGTQNFLSDGIKVVNDGSDAHSACFFVNGHTEFSGEGSLTIKGMVKHAFVSDEYCEIKSTAGKITVAQAVGDGFHIGQYFHQKGGTLQINSIGDGIDVGAKLDITKEFNGQIKIEGGDTDILATGATSDAMKCDALFTMTGGTYKLLATGAGGRALNNNGNINISGGYLKGASCGAVFDQNLLTERKPHGMKSDGNITISGGEVYIAASASSGTAFKTDYFFTINGGILMGIGAKQSVPTAASLQKSRPYLGVNVPAGSVVTYDGVSAQVPAEYSISSGYVLVSKPGM